MCCTDLCAQGPRRTTEQMWEQSGDLRKRLMFSTPPCAASVTLNLKKKIIIWVTCHSLMPRREGIPRVLWDLAPWMVSSWLWWAAGCAQLITLFSAPEWDPSMGDTFPWIPLPPGCSSPWAAPAQIPFHGVQSFRSSCDPAGPCWLSHGVTVSSPPPKPGQFNTWTQLRLLQFLRAKSGFPPLPAVELTWW